MSVVLGVNAVFHDPAAALVVDGRIVAAAEEERFSRRKHGKDCNPFSTWELPERAIRFCLSSAGASAADIDAIAYSYEPRLVASGQAAVVAAGQAAVVSAGQAAVAAAGHGRATNGWNGGHGFGRSAPAPGDFSDPAAKPWDPLGEEGYEDLEALLSCDAWEPLRTLYARRTPHFLRTLLPGLDRARVRFVPHHVAHAASAYLAGPHRSAAVLVLDGRGERASHLAGVAREGSLEVLASQTLPHSLGLLYEEATDHLGFRRSSDEYKVMALAAYGKPRFRDVFRRAVYARGGGFRTERIDWDALVPRRAASDPWDARHADLAASVQQRLEEVVLDLAWTLEQRTGERALVLAGGVALNCVANARLARDGPFRDVWAQPAAGDAGTALGAALYVAHELGDAVEPMRTPALGRRFSPDELAACLDEAKLPYERPEDLAEAVGEALARDGIVAWFQGASEFGPRALGHRSLLANPCHAHNVERLNAVKGREQFRPVAPMVTLERSAEIFDGRLPSPYMLFTHRVRGAWRERIPAALHVDGTARAQTVDAAEEPQVSALLRAFERRTGVPVLVNTSFNTGGRPMVDDPRDALECFGSAPIDVLALGPFLVRRSEAFW